MQQQDLGSILGRVLRESEWNERLARWSKPASETEGDQIERAARMVRAALAQNEWLTDERVEVVPQGSYRNNTNVRTRADMDLCIRHPMIKPIFGAGVNESEALHTLDYVPGRSLPTVFTEMRKQIATTLCNHFGRQNVHPGTKAFTVSAVPGSRSDIDVVPAVKAQIIVPNLSLIYPYRVTEGIMIMAPDGTEIYNYPAIHHANGRAKRERTQYRFKKVVRQMKSMRDDLVDSGALKPKQVPSFLVESMVYLVEDAYFCVDEKHYDRFRRILVRCFEILRDTPQNNLFEINNIKRLFGYHQPWSIEDARAFLQAAYARTET